MLGKVQSVLAIVRDLLIIVFLAAFLILGVQIAEGIEKSNQSTWIDPSIPGQDEGQGGGWGTPIDRNSPVGKTVYVTENLPSEWNVGAGLRFVDQYTTSKFVLVARCPAGAWKCLTIVNGAVKGNHTKAIGFQKDNRITIDVKDARKSGQFKAKTRTWLIAHEVGHYMGLGHREACKTTMNSARQCAKMSFDSAQRAVLKKG
ncbi:MAG: hypothetical protein ABW022_00210 [Actinoplanes sp.]